jgi:glycerol uptake facilitator-like aquaporin
MTLPTKSAPPVQGTYGDTAGKEPLTLYGHQPGLVGVALAQGFILAALLAVTLPLSGGYLNPAITLMLWVFNRLDNRRTWWFIGAQILGGVLAGLCLRYTFDLKLLNEVRMGAPHLNPLVYKVGDRGSLIAGTGIELVLTFFLVFAIFGGVAEPSRARSAALGAGLTLVACVLFAFPLTGAATNPARWFGPVFWENMLPERPAGSNPWGDLFVYLAGPILGALLAGAFYFKVMLPGMKADARDLNEPLPKTDATAAAAGKPASTAVVKKK